MNSRRQFGLFFQLAAGLCVSALAAIATAAPPSEWPYTLPKPTEPPAVVNADWVTNDVDRFINARLESKGLTPAPIADKYTLIKRVYLSLIGLPPTPAEVNQFINNDSPDAYSDLVNRLLDDPRFGEHWARFWLDLARYADTAGYEGDPDMPHAWRYRDYVIDSFNRDKPYDQFIREQLAGDELADILGAGELPNPPSENLVAMTFMRLAPFTEPRGDESRHEMLSEITTTVSSVFLGLTVGCAKCHDHKYDAIPTKDFYRLKAFFATVQIPPPLRGDAFQIGGPTPAAFYRDGEAEWARAKEQQLREDAAGAEAKLSELIQVLKDRLKIAAGFGIQALGGSFGNDYFFDQVAVNDDKPHRTVINAAGGRWQYFTDGELSKSQGSLAGSNRGHWYAGIKTPKYASIGAATNGSGKPQAAEFNGSIAHILVFDRPLSADETTMSVSDLAELEGLQFWLDASDVDADPTTANPDTGVAITSWKDKISGTSFKQSNSDLTPKLGLLSGSDTPAVVFDNDFLATSPELLEFLSDSKGSILTVFSSRDDDESYIFEVGGDGQFITTFVNPDAAGAKALESILADRTDERITDEERGEYYSLTNKAKFLPQHLKRLQPMAMTLRHSFGPPYEPGVPTSRVMIRGEWDHPGEVVEAGFLSAVSGNEQPAEIRLDPFKRWPTRSRRKALADWIASPDNPLTARVIANRLWYRHFGRGIVETPSDFGVLSGGPSHEELLDYLALHLVENDWSLKSLHRLICNSSTFKQASAIENPAALETDLGNIYLWRYPIRRLGAEVVRDRILHVSGRLNTEQFGLPIFPPLPNDIEKRVKYDDSKWATQYDDEGRKRSIYIYQQRTLNMPLLQTFDAPVCDESRPRRRLSTTPLQALAMYNGPLVTAEVSHFANRVFTESENSTDSRIRHAIQIAFCREASAEELSQLGEFFDSFDDEQKAMISVCRVLYNSSEFLYIN